MNKNIQYLLCILLAGVSVEGVCSGSQNNKNSITQRKSKKLSAKKRLVGGLAPILGGAACYGFLQAIAHGDKIVSSALPTIKRIMVPVSRWVVNGVREHPRLATELFLGSAAIFATRKYLLPWALAIGDGARAVVWEGDTKRLEEECTILDTRLNEIAKLFGDILSIRESLFLSLKPEQCGYLYTTLFRNLKALYRKKFPNEPINALSVSDVLKGDVTTYKIKAIKDGSPDHCWSSLVSSITTPLLMKLDDENFMVNYGGKRLVRALKALLDAAEEIKKPGESTQPLITITQNNNNSVGGSDKTSVPLENSVKEFERQARIIYNILAPLFKQLDGAKLRLEAIVYWV